jgi:hypothetical protein
MFAAHNRRTDQSQHVLNGMIVNAHVGASQLAFQNETIPGKVGA